MSGDTSGQPEPFADLPSLDSSSPHVGRRSFLKGAAAIGAGAGVQAIGLVNLGAWKSLAPQKLSEGVIFPDPSLCIGCLTCEVRCSSEHKKAGLAAVPRIRIFNEPATKVDPEVERNYPGRGSFLQQPCLQCPTAECVHVCPVDAFKVEERTGARFIDEDVCVSCGRCAQACPFPIYPEERATNRLTLGQQTRIAYDADADAFAKCDLCYWRADGPACVEACPVNVRIKQGIIKSDRLCLDAPKADSQTWERLRDFQTFEGSPAPKGT